MELDLIKLQTTWNDAASSLNTNFSKIKMALASRQGGGESPVIGGIIVNGMPYTDDDGDGFITLPDYPKKLSALENDLNLGSFAYKNALAVSDIPDLSGKYLPKTGGTIWGAGAELLRIIRTDGNPYISFLTDGNLLGRLGFSTNGVPIAIVNSQLTTLLHSGNYSQYALPLSGGTISGLLTIDRYNALIQYKKNGTAVGYMGIDSELVPIVYSADGLTSKRILHSGNVGEYTCKAINIDSNITDTDKAYVGAKLSAWTNWGKSTNNPNGAAYASGLTISYAANAFQIAKDAYDLGKLYVRMSNYKSDSIPSWSAWKTIAFTDSNVASADYASNAGTLGGVSLSSGSNTPWGTIPMITISGWMDVGRHFEFHYDNATGSDYSTVLSCTGNHGNFVNLPSASGTLALLTDNVASAQALAHSNGTVGATVASSGRVDFSGNIALALNKSILDPSGRSIFMLDGNNNPQIGYDTVGSYSTYINGKDVYLRYGSSRTNGLILNSSGNVTIGGGDLASTTTKLYVDGGIRFAPRTIWGQSFDGTGDVSGHLVLNNQSAIYSYTTSGTSLELFNISSNNNLSIGYSMAGVGGSYLYGNEIYLRYGSSRTNGLILNSSGNVLIGTTTDNNSGAKLQVNGPTRIYRSGSGSEYIDIRKEDIRAIYDGYDPDGYCHHEFRSNGTATFFINGTNGNVGIGTTNPQAKLHVSGGLRTYGDVFFFDSSGNNRITFTHASDIARIYNTGNSSTMYIGEYNGNALNIVSHNVGIGTTSPACKLDVAGNIRTKGFYINRKSDNAEAFEIINIDDTNGFDIRTLGGYSFLSFSTSTTTPSEKMRIMPNGNVGIGTIDPQYKLDVAGTGRFTGKTTHGGGIDIPNGQQLAFLDASGNRHTIAWDSASNGILIDGNLIVLGELATGLPMQEIPSIPEIGV